MDKVVLQRSNELAVLLNMPLFAPLNILQVLQLLKKEKCYFSSSLTSEEKFVLQVEAQMLANRIKPVRREVVLAFSSAQKKKKLNQSFFEKYVGATRQSVSNWRNEGYIRPTGRGFDLDSAVSIAISQRLQPRERDLIPKLSLPIGEPHQWCYGRACPMDGQEQPVCLCPLPLPSRLPPGMLLWTPYPLFDRRQWLSIQHFGSVAFSNVSVRENETFWSISYQHLARWDSSLLNLDMNMLFYSGPDGEESLHSFADNWLRRQCLYSLKNPTAPTNSIRFDSAPQEVMTFPLLPVL